MKISNETQAAFIDEMEKIAAERGYSTVSAEVSDREAENLARLLSYIRGLANPGHSFEVVVDPDDRQNAKKFGIDGDGGFHMKSIAINGERFEKTSAKKSKKLPGPGDMAYYSEKRAGFLQNLGKPIVHTGRWISRAADDVGQALHTTISHPLQGMAAGAATTGEQLSNSFKQMRSGGVRNAVGGMVMPGMLALGLYGGIKSLKGDVDPTGMGRGKGERWGDFLGSQAGWLIGAKHGIPGSIAAGLMAQKAGAFAGRMVDKARGYQKPADSDRRMSTAVYNTFSPVPRARRRQGQSAPPLVQAPAPARPDQGGGTAA
jgi:hypothetical protein